MKEFIALPTWAGSFTWQIPYQGHEDADRQEGVRFSFHGSSLLREGALAHLAATLADLGETWIRPVAAPDGSWVIRLGNLPERFSELRGQAWLGGERVVQPEFDIVEHNMGPQPRKIGVIRFVILPGPSEPNAVGPKVFISYAREDESDARRLYQVLKDCGASPWLDQFELTPGENWRSAMRKAIEGSDFFVALLSSRSTRKRGYAQAEIRYALDVLNELPGDSIYLIPVRLDDCEPSHDRLHDLHWLNMFPSWEAGVQRLISVIQGRREAPQAVRQSPSYERNSRFGTELMSALVRVQVFGNEPARLRAEPWRDKLIEVFGEVSRWLTDHSHESVPADLGLVDGMEDLALKLDQVTAHVHVAGGGGKLKEKIAAAVGAAASLQSDLTGKGPLTEEARSEVISMLGDQQRKLAAWMGRMRAVNLYESGRFEIFIDAVVEIGFQVAYISYFPLDWLTGMRTAELRKVGETLHLIGLTAATTMHKTRGDIVDLVGDAQASLRVVYKEAGLPLS